MKASVVALFATFATRTSAFAPVGHSSPAVFSRNMSANAVPLANGASKCRLDVTPEDVSVVSFESFDSHNLLPIYIAVSFDRVCREWRCKYTGDKATSESLEAISKLVDEYLPQVKAASKDATVNRLVCGSCLDFKLMTTVSSM